MKFRKTKVFQEKLENSQEKPFLRGRVSDISEKYAKNFCLKVGLREMFERMEKKKLPNRNRKEKRNRKPDKPFGKLRIPKV